MIASFWNIRGALKKNACSNIKDFCASNQISIFMVCEVKSKAPPTQLMAN